MTTWIFLARMAKRSVESDSSSRKSAGERPKSIDVRQLPCGWSRGWVAGAAAGE